MFGFLSVYKPVGKTSHGVVAYFRKLLKINSTRLIEYLPDDKAYLAFVQFGKATDSYDIEGNVIFQSDKKVAKEDVEQALKKFEGDIEQLPPIYSAIKVNGKKLYEYAREGKSVEIKPRKVTIYKIELKNFDYDNDSYDFNYFTKFQTRYLFPLCFNYNK